MCGGGGEGVPSRAREGSAVGGGVRRSAEGRGTGWKSAADALNRPSPREIHTRKHTLVLALPLAQNEKPRHAKTG